MKASIFMALIASTSASLLDNVDHFARNADRCKDVSKVKCDIKKFFEVREMGPC
jgi:hypothetical protein